MCLGRHCRDQPVHVSQVGRCPHMCPWVGPQSPSFRRQLWGLPSRVECLSPQGVLLPLVYGTTASPLWLELRDHSVWQATPSWTVYRLTCHRLLRLGPVALEYRSCPWPGRSAGSPQCVQTMGCWFFPVPRPPYVCAVSRASWLLFTGVLAWFAVLCLRCPWPLDSCSPVRPLGVVCCVCGVPGHWAPVQGCARWVCRVPCAASWATWLPFTGAPARCVVLRARCPGPLGSCSPVRLLCLLFCLCGVLGHLAPVHRCPCAVCCVVSAVSRAAWLLFTGAPPRCVVLRVRCPGPLGPRSPVCPLGVLCCVCGVLGHLASVHRCARSCVALLARCPGPLGSCSPVCLLCVLSCLCGVLGHLAPVHRCARSVCCFVCAVSWASWLLFTGVQGRGVPSLCCPRSTRVCAVLAPVPPVHRCACCVRCACAVDGCVPLPPP